MNNREPSWWHMLWSIPSVIATEALMVLGIMRKDKGGKHGR